MDMTYYPKLLNYEINDSQNPIIQDKNIRSI